MLHTEFWIMMRRYFTKLIVSSIIATLMMVVATVSIGFVLGFGLSVLLIICEPNGLNPKRRIYNVLDFFVNTISSFPILILIVAVSPITIMIVGTTVGEKAAIFPLSIAATVLIARMLENSFKEVGKQLIEAARSFGATDLQIMFKIIVKESVPSIISIATLSTITYIASTTIAGAVGGWGLGAVVLNYG